MIQETILREIGSIENSYLFILIKHRININCLETI